MSDRIVLAYSGGLDTSVCIGWLTEQTGQEVVAVAVIVMVTGAGPHANVMIPPLATALSR